jgi:hypothetical protein
MPNKLKILRGLPTNIAHNKKLLKTVSAFLVLKAEINTSILLDYPGKIKHLARWCQCSQRTFYTRMKEMMKMGWIKLSGYNMELTSYKKFYESIGCESSSQFFYYKKHIVKAEYILRTLAIQENFNRQEGAMRRKIEKEYQGSGPSVNYKAVKAAAKHRLVSDFIHTKDYRKHDHFRYNPDVAIGQERMASIFGLKSASSGFYWQKVLTLEKLIAVTKREVESDCRCRKSPMGKVYFSRKTQKTYCQLPNRVTVL